MAKTNSFHVKKINDEINVIVEEERRGRSLVFLIFKSNNWLWYILVLMIALIISLSSIYAVSKNIKSSTKIEYEIINGTGSSTVKGINAISYVNNTNGVQYNGSTGITAANVRTLIGLLHAGYDKGAKFLMDKKTLFNQFMGLQDNSKCDIVRVEGGNYYIYGYPVILSDEITTGVAFLGNFKKYVGNLNRDVEVKKDFDIDTNSYKYLGVGIFDGKPACENAFVKIATSL